VSTAPGTGGATTFETLRAWIDEDGRLLWIVLDRPKGNVLSRRMILELDEVLVRHRDDPRLKLVVLRGAGGQFSFGAAVDEHRPDQAPLLLRTLHDLARRLASHPVPVAALVEGRCLGGALELALCCHFVLARRDARFACPEIKLGVFPPLFAVAGATRFGGALAERLILTGDEIDAAAAERCGFAAALLPGEADAEDEARAWYRSRLAPLSAFAIRETTRAVRERSPLTAALGAPLEASERDYLERILPSHDGNEGIEAFLARRAPQWRDA
jgi:cyclohexa-1,5-dienecarbonyl-CoA hydratase